MKNSRVRLLINGAAGGVGSWTVQIARLAGIESIAAIVGTQSIDFIQQLGETEVIDYKKQTIGEWVAEYPEFRQYDLVLDYIGKPDVAQTWYAVREGGTLIAISFAPEDIRPNDVKKQANAFLFIIDLVGKDLNIITKLLESGKLKPNIDSVISLDVFEEAWDKAESGRAKGKVVVKIIDEE
ncbi:putative zinc-binding oxidoreductase [Fusarium oxysporum f. sp. rapae]|uniref:Putative zinc-binding oxidoreductase n=1 Tax=Fusarium oxysporum f. sp. rapae TaxID=485398 RepID=A0A8J5NUF2_FUSOX|nr:putative zinc-binding oxidoreductase [Fusarium oxysporum f. sp. rapae]